MTHTLSHTEALKLLSEENEELRKRLRKNYSPERVEGLFHAGALKVISEDNEELRKANRILAADRGHYRMWWETKVKPLLAAAQNVRDARPGNLEPGSQVELDFEALDRAIEEMEGGPTR